MELVRRALVGEPSYRLRRRLFLRLLSHLHRQMRKLLPLKARRRWRSIAYARADEKTMSMWRLKLSSSSCSEVCRLLLTALNAFRRRFSSTRGFWSVLVCLVCPRHRRRGHQRLHRVLWLLHLTLTR